MTRTTIKYLAAGAILVSAVGYLAYASMKDGWTCYHLPVDSYLQDSKYQSQRVRLAGKVSEENLKAGGGKLGAEFVLLGESKSIPVTYQGIVPDLFKGGVEVVVEGRLEGGVFKSDVMMTKCASKYESKGHEKKGQAS